jgi:hypothetical protein
MGGKHCHRRPLADCAMRSHIVVIPTPRFDFHSGIVKAQELVLVESFVTNTGIEAFDERADIHTEPALVRAHGCVCGAGPAQGVSTDTDTSIDAGQGRDKLGAYQPGSKCEHDPPAPVPVQALNFFSENLLQHFLVEAQIRYQPS